jgi:hypothetical protein
MSRADDRLWAKLCQAGVVQGPAPASPGTESPWYVKALLAFSGWLAAIFLFGFVAVGFQFIAESVLASLISGSVLIAAAYGLLRAGKNPFVEHLALAVSLAGQAWVVWALFRFAEHQEALAWLLVAMLQAPLAAVMPHFVHRVFSTFAAAVAVAMALNATGTPYVFSGGALFLAAWLWRHEFRYSRHVRKIQAIGYGLVLALIPLKGSVLFGHGALGWRSPHDLAAFWLPPWMGEVLAGAAMLYVVWPLLPRRGRRVAPLLAVTAVLATLLLGAVSLEAPGITVGITIILLGFAGGNRPLMGVGIVSLLFFISSYYYLLDTTLLAKSRTLLMVGLGLLAARGFILRRLPGTGEARHA